MGKAIFCQLLNQLLEHNGKLNRSGLQRKRHGHRQTLPHFHVLDIGGSVGIRPGRCSAKQAASRREIQEHFSSSVRLLADVPI
jgi:hypothetical protein